MLERVQKDDKFGAINAEQRDTCKENAFKITAGFAIAESIQKTDAIQEMQWDFKITDSRKLEDNNTKIIRQRMVILLTIGRETREKATMTGKQSICKRT